MFHTRKETDPKPNEEKRINPLQINIFVVYLLTYTLSLNSVIIMYWCYSQPLYHLQVDVALHLSRQCQLTMSLLMQYNGTVYCIHIPVLHTSHAMCRFLKIYRDRTNSDNTNHHCSAKISPAKNLNTWKFYQKTRLPGSCSIEQRQGQGSQSSVWIGVHWYDVHRAVHRNIFL
jgi:hypothetical protein